ncbi:MAG: TonB-dependent receptor [Asticcacaulis sp.]
MLTVLTTGAAAQETAATPPAATASSSDNTTVVITGSILRKKNFQSISPLTTISAADLEKRGVTTIESAVQNVAGNNGGAMNNNWNASGNFAAGASGVSLRGLTTNSTLVLVDGLRMAYYPLADDATRNFVDLNTIPDAIVDHVEVLQDGASATYGSDAIAGVVNVITKKNFQGFSGRAEVGAPEHDGAGERSFSGIWGKGDLNTDGYNFYVGAEYQKNDILLAKDAGFPYNTADQSSYCGHTSITDQSKYGTTNGINAQGISCRTNAITNGIQFDDVFAGAGTTTVAEVRPFDATNTTAQGAWQMLNPTLGCGALNSVTVTANQARYMTAANAAAVVGSKFCQQDLTNQFNTIMPDDERKSVSARFTKRFSDTMEGYVAANFYENSTYFTGRGGPRNIQAVTTPGAAGTSVNLTNIALPVYICPRATVGDCTVGNGSLNPQNPFAAAGDVARLLYRFGDTPYYVKTKSDTFRIAAGLSGFADGWNYNVDFTAMKSKLDYDKYGSINLQHVLDVVKDGTYNFMDPSQNSQAVRDYVAPASLQKAESELVQLQASASKSLMDLAGGPLQLGVGAAIRYERVKNPSANPDNLGANPFDRYDGAINPFGATGYRHVTSASAELDAPFTDKLDVNLQARADSYSTGFANISPKIGVSYQLFKTVKLRGTFSKGFRAPSIAENNSDPSTGFVTLNAPADFQAAHGNNGYGNQYSVGLTTVAAKNLKPETAKNATLGIVWQPTHNLGFSLDYFNIHKDNIIQAGDASPAIAAYFAGQPIPTGFTVTPGVPDPQNPGLQATPGFVTYSLVNLSAQDIAGVDASLVGRFDIPGGNLTSSLNTSYIQYYFQTYPDGSRQRYDGTLGNNQITSGSGTPKWKGNWQNTFDFGKLSLTATAYYVSGYKEVAADNGDDIYAPCGEGTTAAKYRDNKTPVSCNIDSFTSVDLHGAYKITSNYTIALDVLNAFGAKAPYDPSGTYGISLYNPAFTSSGMLGRYWKLSGKVTF